MTLDGAARDEGVNVSVTCVRAGEGPDSPPPTHLPTVPNGPDPAPPTVPGVEPHPVVDPTPVNPPAPVRDPPAGAPPPMRA